MSRLLVSNPKLARTAFPDTNPEITPKRLLLYNFRIGHQPPGTRDRLICRTNCYYQKAFEIKASLRVPWSL